MYLIAYYNECNCSTAPPRFTSKPPPLIFIKEGGNLALSISVSGNPQPKITWSVRLKIHENESRVNSTGDEKFELNYIRFEDEGVITCRAENVFGVQETEVEVTVLGKFIIITIFFSGRMCHLSKENIHLVSQAERKLVTILFYYICCVC